MNHQTPASCIESLQSQGYIVTRPDTRPNTYHEHRFVQLHDELLSVSDCQEHGCNELAVASDMDDVDLHGDDRLAACDLCLVHVLSRQSAIRPPN